VTDTTTVTVETEGTGQVHGQLQLRVHQAYVEQFLTDPEVKEGLSEAIAAKAGCPSGWVNVTLSLATRRRRLQESGTDGSNIRVDYIITIPPTAPAKYAEVTADTVSTAIERVSEGQWSVEVNNQGLSYAITVKAITKPIVTEVGEDPSKSMITTTAAFAHPQAAVTAAHAVAILVGMVLLQ